MALAACLGAAAPPSFAFSPPDDSSRETIVGPVVDFAALPVGPYERGRLDFWRWSNELRARAAELSRVQVDGDGDRRALHVRIDGPLPFADGAIPLARLAPFFPPEADVLRLRIQVVSGELRAFVGGPTAYYANSDVFTPTARLAAAPHWTTLDFPLNQPLRRNYRRAGFSTDARRNYYNRWAQEPIGVYLDEGTRGVFRIERIELVARGQGRPFPRFAADDVRLIRTIADFEDGDRAGAFTLYMADAETEWFEQSWKREKPLRFAPPEIRVEDEPERGGKSLVCVGAFAEEVQCTGVPASGGRGANALRVEVHHDAPEHRNTVVGLGRAEPVDFLIFVAPPAKPFPWSQFAPSAELRRQGVGGFDFQLSYRAIRDRQDVDFAVYQTRRYLAPRTWTTLVMPAADFVCVYGSGACRERFLRNSPLNCDEAIAAAWIAPWCRVGRRGGNVALRFDSLAFVRVPGDGAAHRSFWQRDGEE